MALAKIDRGGKAATLGHASGLFCYRRGVRRIQNLSLKHQIRNVHKDKNRSVDNYWSGGRLRGRNTQIRADVVWSTNRNRW
jgi:hypothetical protein